MAPSTLCRHFLNLDAEFHKFFTGRLFCLRFTFVLNHIFCFFFQEKMAQALAVKNEAIKGLETAIEEEKKEQWRVEGRKYLFDAKRVRSSGSTACFCSPHYAFWVPLRLRTSNKPFTCCVLQTGPVPPLHPVNLLFCCCFVFLPNANLWISSSVSRTILLCCWKQIIGRDCWRCTMKWRKGWTIRWPCRI